MADDAAFLKELIRDIPDWPRPGVGFKDITPLLNDVEAFRYTIDAIATHFASASIDRVLGVEARGFLLAAPVAYRFGAGSRADPQGRQAAVGDRAGGVRARVRHRPARDPS